jgi:cytochrome c
MTLNARHIFMGAILLFLLLLCAGCTQAQPQVQTPAPMAVTTATDTAFPPTPSKSPTITTKEKMVAFVKEAVAYAKEHGKEQALSEFSNRNGSFFRGELYIYAYDINGTTIAHPVNPEKIGVKRLNENDAEGNLFITNLRTAAVNGTGFVTYYYINPTHDNIEEKKLGYVMSVDDTWWLGSGIYQGPADTPLAPATEPMPPAAVVTTLQGK